MSNTQTTFGYDQADRLTGFTRGSGSATYKYDGDGLRAGKTVNGTAVAETWDVAEGLPLMIQDGSIKYITGPDGLPIEQVDGSGSVDNYLQDQLGGTRGLLDASGNVIGEYSFNPYGDLKGHSGAGTPFGYAGQYTDSESGLQYLRAPYYDPSAAQFLSADPLVRVSGQPYQYTPDDPLTYTDPAGTLWWIVAGAAVGALVGVAATGVATNWQATPQQYLAAAAGGAVTGGIGAIAGPLGGTFAMDWREPSPRTPLPWRR